MNRISEKNNVNKKETESVPERYHYTEKKKKSPGLEKF